MSNSDSLVRRVLGHTRALEAMLVGSQLAGILASIVVARSIGPTGRGTIVTLTVWGQILGWLAALSLDKAIMVLTAHDRIGVSADDSVRAARLPVVFTSLLVGVIGALLGQHFFANVWLSLCLVTLAMATAQAELVSGWLLAMARRRAFVLWRISQALLYLVLLSIVAVVLVTASVGQRTVVMALAATFSMVLPVAYALRRMPRHPALSTKGLGPILRFGLTAHVGVILLYLNGRLDLLTLSFLVHADRLGVYAVGAALGQVVVLTASAGVIRGITGERDSTDLVGIGVAACLAAIVIAASPVVVPLAFGRSFEASVPIARILAVGGVINFALLAAVGRLFGRGRPWAVALSEGIGVAVFALGIGLFPTLYGAAWSSVVSFAVALAAAQAALAMTPAQRGADQWGEGRRTP